MQSFRIIKKVMFASALFLIAGNVQAKSLFKEATIIQNGVTTHGLIEVKSLKYSPKEIKFKSDENADVQILTADDIDLFKVGDREFIARDVMLESSAKHIQKLSHSSDLQYRKTTVFVQKLVDGKKDLYVYKARGANPQFFIEGDKGLEVLGYKRYYSTVDGAQVVRYNNLYQQQLLNYLGDCNQIFDVITDSNYDIASMKRIFKTYNKCSA